MTASAADVIAIFRAAGPSLGNYKSLEEATDAKQIGQASQILYVTLRFEHAAIYGRFLCDRTDRDWVVQNMDFSTRPEAVMPWLACSLGKITRNNRAEISLAG